MASVAVISRGQPGWCCHTLSDATESKREGELALPSAAALPCRKAVAIPSGCPTAISLPGETWGGGVMPSKVAPLSAPRKRAKGGAPLCVAEEKCTDVSFPPPPPHGPFSPPPRRRLLLLRGPAPAIQAPGGQHIPRGPQSKWGSPPGGPPDRQALALGRSDVAGVSFSFFLFEGLILRWMLWVVLLARSPRGGSTGRLPPLTPVGALVGGNGQEAASCTSALAFQSPF